VKGAATLQAGTGASDNSVLDWRHAPEKYGSPKQSWTASQKIVWTLYVAGKETGTTEMGAGQICRTFNKHFRQAGQLIPQNMPRDLARLKTGPRGELPQVSENSTGRPAKWFLTEAGEKTAQQLISALLAQPA
jgi:hypothetical protein